MKNDEKGMNLHKKKGLELSDQDLDAVTGGYRYTIRSYFTKEKYTTVTGLKALEKWLNKNPREDIYGYQIDIVGSGWIEIFSGEKYYQNLCKKIESMPGVAVAF